jgi:signal transduction histidine kinase
MQSPSLFVFLAKSRLFGVGLAVVAEISLLVALSFAPASGEAGIPAALTAAIAGTVAVVFGVLDGIVLALIGALVFGALEGWSVDELGPLVVWPGIVAAVGLFARRVEHRRALFHQVVSDQERERGRLAVELHDQEAQALAGALMMLSAAGHSEGGASAAEQARSLIKDTIKALRTLAADLTPRTLEVHGLVAAVEQLAATLSDTAGVSIRVEGGWSGRVSNEAELALYRVVQEALAMLVAEGERELTVTLDRKGGNIVVSIEHGGDVRGEAAHQALTERLRLLGGRLRVVPSATGGTRLQAELPTAPHPRTKSAT